MGQDDEDDAHMLQAKQQITYNVINKRKDQLRRWQSSEMNAEPARRMKRPKVQFQDSDIFLSACMSGDEEEVDELLTKGADINTCTVDGLTALHQSVIDSKPDMVRFLCEKGADVNAQDNEGWTPLHAAACCGNVAIVQYLCQHGADLSIVNSDKELALDLADDEQCRALLEEDYRIQKIDIDGCREKELNAMLRDAKVWLTTGEYKDEPHHRTGGTAMHVAAARGYTQLLELLIKAGGNLRAQDKDGWTPLHAAAHWAEKDACKILIESGAELTDTTFAGQDVCGIADKDIVEYLVELGETAKVLREKRKSPSVISSPASVLQEKNHRTPSHEDHILSSDRKKDLQHRDQFSENEFLHHMPPSSPSSISSSTATTTITIGEKNSRESSKELAENGLKDEEMMGEDVDEEEGDEEEEDEEVEDEKSEMETNGKELSSRSATNSISEPSRSVSVTRSIDEISSNRTSSERDTSVENSVTASESARSTSVTNSSSRYGSSTPSSQRSVSVPPSVAASETPRSSMETSSVGSGDQNVSATVPIVPSSAPPPKVVHQQPSSWINRGFPLSSRNSASSVSRSSSTPVSEIISPPTSLHSLNSIGASSIGVASSSSTVLPSSSAPVTPSTNVMSGTIASNAKNSPSPAGSVTISATFTKPSPHHYQKQSHHHDDVFRSPSQPNNVPWASLWQSVNNSSTGQIRNQIQQLRNASSSSLSTTLPRVSAFRPPTKTVQPNSNSPSSNLNTNQVSEYPKGFVPHQINPVKMSRWQSKTVTESEAERRNNSRMQRQHRRSTQGVTKEQLEEASRFACDEASRRNSTVLSATTLNNSVRLASEEKDLSSNSEDLMKDGDVSTTATFSLNSPNSNASSVRRKSQGLSISRSNRRATGPVNPEDLVVLRASENIAPNSPSMGLRLAAAPPVSGSSQPYSPASIRSVAGTLPTMTSSRFGSEKAHSLPPPMNGNGNTPSSNALSTRSAVVAGLSPAPSMRNSTTSGPLMNSGTRFGASSSFSSNNSVNPTSSYIMNNRPTETNLNYKALYEKEKNETERLRRELDDVRRNSADNHRGLSSTTPAWRARNASPSSAHLNMSVAKSTSLASFDENERRSMERKIVDLELQLKTAANLRMENQRLKEENGALVRVISKMTI